MKTGLCLLVLSLVFSGCATSSSVPEGFQVVEDISDDSFIIADAAGNEFVWIPVSGDLHRYDFHADKEVKENDAIERIFYGEERKESIVYDTEYNIEGFKNSVRKHGGFFISRYEIGDSSADGFRESDVQGTPVSKKDCYPYNYITRDAALRLANEIFTSENAYGSLPSSYAYDCLINYIKDEISFDKTKEQLMKTGQSNDEIKGICDLSGNVSEWTTEYCSDSYYDFFNDCVNRGSNYSDASADPYQRNYNTNVSNSFIGFRVVIYFK